MQFGVSETQASGGLFKLPHALPSPPPGFEDTELNEYENSPWIIPACVLLERIQANQGSDQVLVTRSSGSPMSKVFSDLTTLQ